MATVYIEIITALCMAMTLLGVKNSKADTEAVARFNNTVMAMIIIAVVLKIFKAYGVV